MAPKHIPIASALIVGLIALGSFFYLSSPGPVQETEWGGPVFEGLFFLFILFWNLAVLPHWKSSKILCLGSLFLLAGSFADVCDNFFIQPRWQNWLIENLLLTSGAGLFGVGIWHWVREKERLLDQLQKERDFEASLIPKLSHDLRVPLTNLCGMVNIAEDDPKFLDDPARRQQFLEVMMRGAKQLGLLIDNILESHLLKTGKIALKPDSVSLFRLLDETCRDFQYQAKTKQITIERDCPEGELTVEADQVKVVRIVQNLLHNAIKFSPKGGKVALKARVENGAVTIRIADEGPGIAADQILAIMQEAPWTNNKENEARNQGYGIGLKVVKEFVRLHGGRFWIEPNSPQGAQFCFSLPLRQASVIENPKSQI